ncbi:general stress protein CsbA [Nocardia transvalensis]|uniref:General stress protein CsbA n=1 Tax=Nocardia transvalensis TaxID=37333 RepID=A0A7W9PA70_9NOCA|nr:tryptophan-rich sensory protein [Nocardia transvalensis]MBB5912013.1 general stress protein CsbA [Nocardia transvalensis]
MSNPQMAVASGTADGLRVHHREQSQAGRRAAATGTVAASVLLIIAGTVQILQGISAVAADEIIIVGPQYTYGWDTTGWGVVHIVIGALFMAVAAALFSGATWARIVAIVLAGLSIVANFLWLPHNPWWAVLIIALDIFLIWAVATWRPQGTDSDAVAGEGS